MTSLDPERRQETVVDLTPDRIVRRTAPPRVDFERGMSPWPRLTLALIGCHAIVFAWMLGTDALADVESIIAAGALHRAGVAAGEVWRLVTATFLHAGLDHLLGNALVLYIVGMGCEHAFGVPRTAALYATSALAGSLFSVTGGPGPSVGASGAVFGVMAALAVVVHRNRDVLRLRDARIGIVLGVWGLFQIVSGFTDPRIDNLAHIGGAAAGAALASVLPSRFRPAS